MVDAASLSDDMHVPSDDYAATEAGDGVDTDNMMMGEDEEQEQAAAERLREELKAKRQVGRLLQLCKPLADLSFCNQLSRVCTLTLPFGGVVVRIQVAAHSSAPD